MFKRKDCRLRPLNNDDLELVLEWRNAPGIREMMFTDHIITLTEHQRWFAGTQSNLGHSRHWVFECNGKPLGQVNITHIDEENRRCYWGFFIGAADAPRGSGSVMGFLVLEAIFEGMNLNKLCSEVLVSNTVSINYHKKLGFVEEGCFKEHVIKQGSLEDIVCLAYFSNAWQQRKNMLFDRFFGGK